MTDETDAGQQGTHAAPSEREIREELNELVRLELLGPKEGECEEIDETRIVDRYLVGMLAPRRHVVGQERDEGFEESVAPSSSDDGAADPVPNRSDSLLPSSFGLTFVVDDSVDRLTVEASWGKYDRVESETIVKDDGSPKRVWRRKPMGGAIQIDVTPGPIAPVTPDATEPGVVIRGVVRQNSGERTVTLFLVNQQEIEQATQLKDRFWLFQAALAVHGESGASPFRRRQRRRTTSDSDDAFSREERELAMLYRHEQEFAVGHGVAVDWMADPNDLWRATEIHTVAIPSYEVRQQTPPTPDDEGYEGLSDLELRMDALAGASSDRLTEMLNPLVDSYDAWIDRQASRIVDPLEGLTDYGQEAARALDHCRATSRRIRAGIELLAQDANAADAFRFANEAMWQQRIHSIFSLGKRRNPDSHPSIEQIDSDPRNKSWYPFQLAFILLNLASVTDLHHHDRSHPTDAIADLLWFPTGGGKTEAYLGLAAYTMGLRRLQGTIEGRVGHAGVSVLMRYTLRLLTLQQFQRATALLCAMEVIRRRAVDWGDTRWGTSDQPFNIGLWVGAKSTPNWTRDSKTVVDALRQGDRFSVAGKGSPRQLLNCPWCGTEIRPRNLEVETVSGGRGRTFTYCDDPTCCFSKRHAATGLPVLVVDEEIYRQLPTLLIATVDKFAQMPWNGLTEMLFGRLEKYCPRHGFRSPDTDDKDRHNRRGPFAAATSVDHAQLRPPDLIIQDELHLISGPLGSMVGLYETAIDELCTWEVDGRRVRPKVVASTATVRNARHQIHELFCRTLSVFPPPGLDAAENFFSKRREVTDRSGRQYIGICAPGRSLKASLIRTFVAFLSAGTSLYERYDTDADAWLTAVGYFNSLRELGGMRRMIDEDVRNRLRHMDRRGLSRRILYKIEELTSRKSSSDIPFILDRLETKFSRQSDRRREEAARSGLEPIPRPIDVLLATSMISVGVDIDRLGLMIVGGQPKATSEYIQATSRVGRRHPGLVCTVYNWARPRDLSHYERFRHYHATFYQQVEALSVTPFAARAIDRGLAALLVTLVRHGDHSLNGNKAASRVDGMPGYSEAAIQAIARRVENIEDTRLSDEVRARLGHLAHEWASRASKTATLVYRRHGRDDVSVPLLLAPEAEEWSAFTCLNSLRDVEPSSPLILVEDATQPRR